MDSCLEKAQQKNAGAPMARNDSLRQSLDSGECWRHQISSIVLQGRHNNDMSVQRIAAGRPRFFVGDNVCEKSVDVTSQSQRSLKNNEVYIQT